MKSEILTAVASFIVLSAARLSPAGEIPFRHVAIDDGAVDSYWPMNHEMAVFGFGRKDLNKYIKHVPARFIVGFCENTESVAVSRAVQSAYRPLSIVVGELQACEQVVSK